MSGKQPRQPPLQVKVKRMKVKRVKVKRMEVKRMKVKRMKVKRCAGGEQLSPPAVEIFEENSHPGCGIPPLPKERTRNTGGCLNLMLNEEPVSTRKDAPLISSLT